VEYATTAAPWDIRQAQSWFRTACGDVADLIARVDDTVSGRREIQRRRIVDRIHVDGLAAEFSGQSVDERLSGHTDTGRLECAARKYHLHIWAWLCRRSGHACNRGQYR
jgi:hypothetical protein